MPYLVMENEKKHRLRKTFGRWKDKLDKDLQPIASQQPTPLMSPVSPLSFTPATQTNISASADPTNRQASNLLVHEQARNNRRDTASADFFAQTGTTTTITATATSAPKNRVRLSLLLSRCFSSQQQLSPTWPVLSPSASATAPQNHGNERVIFQFTTATEAAAQTRHDARNQLAAAEITRRDEPKGWLDPIWRRKEEEETHNEETDELLKFGGINLGRDGVDSTPLRRRELGK